MARKDTDSEVVDLDTPEAQAIIREYLRRGREAERERRKARQAARQAEDAEISRAMVEFMSWAAAERERMWRR